MTELKRITVFTGAGISAESGLQTFRGIDGLWEGHRIEDVATPEGWNKNPELVLRFYNVRREAMRKAKPNLAHLRVAELERFADVWVITQNIDDLHERAGSSKVLHLHGEILKARSSIDPNLVYDLGERDIKIGDLCERGSQLRPHVVWFGEELPNFSLAYEISIQSDAILVIGTSLQVFPANRIVFDAPESCQVYVLDPCADELPTRSNWRLFPMPATIGIDDLIAELKQQLNMSN